MRNPDMVEPEAEAESFEAAGFDRRRANNWIARHWRGDLSLGVSYWVNNLIGAAASVIFGIFVVAVFQATRNPRINVVAILLCWLFVIAVTIWQIVGTWRSAGRSQRSSGRSFWPRIARIFLVLGLLSVVKAVVQTGVPELSDSIDYATGDEAQGPRGVRVLRNGTELEVTGFFGYGLAQDLKTALARNPAVKVVHLASAGGRVAVGRDIGDLIATHGLDTYVAASCASACTVAFLAGKKRWMAEGPRLGFHRFSYPGALASDTKREVRTTYAAAGVPAAFLDHIEATPPEELWFPKEEELLAAGVVTARAPSGTFALSGFGLSPSRETIEAQLLSDPAYAALRSVDPEAWLVVRDAWIRAVQDGQPETAAVTVTQAEMGKARQQARTRMPDDLAIAFAKQLIAEFKAIQAVDPEVCFTYATAGGVDMTKYLSPGLLKDDLQLNESLLSSVAAHPAEPVDAAEGKRLVAKAFATMPGVRADPGRIAAGLRSGASHDLMCPSLWAVYEAVLRLPTGENAAAVRYLIGAK